MHRTSVWTALTVVILTGCPKEGPPPLEEFEPTLIPSSDAVVWQGFDHSWLYNHRWGRLGSGFVYASPELDRGAYPLREHPLVEIPQVAQWTYMGSAGAGTGIDFGTHIGRGATVSSPDAKFASMTANHRIEGPEGETVTDRWSIEATLPDTMVGEPIAAAFLNGFWLRSSGDEAKQPFHFSIDLGEATVDGDALTVDVTLAMGVDCDTPECEGCTAAPGSKRSDDFSYDVYVDVLIVAGESGAVGSSRFIGPDVEASWDGPPELDGDEACLSERDEDDCVEYWIECGDPRLASFDEMPAETGSAQVTETTDFPNGTVGITGLELDLNRPHHMIQFRADATNVEWTADGLQFDQTLRFQNWRQQMNLTGQDADPRAATAFGTDGSYSGRLKFAKLGFTNATIEPLELEERIITEASKDLVLTLD